MFWIYNGFSDEIHKWLYPLELYYFYDIIIPYNQMDVKGKGYERWSKSVVSWESIKRRASRYNDLEMFA